MVLIEVLFTVPITIETEKEPLRDDLIDMLHKRPSLKERSSTSKRLKNRIVDFVETYNTGVGV
jgi:type I restriction enzyme R subunit